MAEYLCVCRTFVGDVRRYVVSDVETHEEARKALEKELYFRVVIAVEHNPIVEEPDGAAE